MFFWIIPWIDLGKCDFRRWFLCIILAIWLMEEIPRPTTWDASSPGKQWDFNYQPQLPSKWLFLRFFFSPAKNDVNLPGLAGLFWALGVSWCFGPLLCRCAGLLDLFMGSLEQWAKMPLQKGSFWGLPSRKLTYPTWGKGKSSSKCHSWGIC